MSDLQIPSEKKPLRKRAIYILPNLFTSASLFLGFLCMTLSFEGFHGQAALCIFFSAFMDGLDGKVARLTGTSSEFGVQYDSLADLVAFGAAPAVLVWSWHLQAYGRLGIGVAFLVMACAALRLARFNVAASSTHSQNRFFIGLPSPAAGCTLAGFVLLINRTPETLGLNIPLLTLSISALVALLMVSRVRYYSFKEIDWAKKHPFRTMVSLFLVFIAVFSRPDIFIFLIMFIYIIIGICYTYVYVPLRARKLIKTAQE